MSQVVATAVALAELAEAEALEGTGARLLVAHVQDLAEQVDENPGNAALWGQYRAAWSDLREGTAGDDAERTASSVMARLGAAAVGDPTQN